MQQEVDVFSHGGGRRAAEAMDVHFLAELALDPEVRVGGDSGRPVALRDQNDPHSAAYIEMARETISRLAEAGRKTPTMEITD